MFNEKLLISEESIEGKIDLIRLKDEISFKIRKLEKNGILNVALQEPKDSKVSELELEAIYKVKTIDIPNHLLFKGNVFLKSFLDILKCDMINEDLNEMNMFLKFSYITVHSFTKEVIMSKTPINKKFYIFNVIGKNKIYSIMTILSKIDSQDAIFKSLLTVEPENTILYDSSNDEDESDYIFTIECLEELVEKHFTKNTSEYGYAFLSQRYSHYGAIGKNGFTGYSDLRRFNDLTDAIRHLFKDELSISVDYKNNIYLNYKHHDGIDTCQIIKMNKTMSEEMDYLDLEDIIELLSDAKPVKYKK